MPRGGLKSCTEGGKIAQEENNFRARVARAGQNNSFPPLTNFSSTPLIGTISDVLITFVEDALGNRASSIIGSVTFL